MQEGDEKEEQHEGGEVDEQREVDEEQEGGEVADEVMPACREGQRPSDRAASGASLVAAPPPPRAS
eukprot:6863918-Pyramimonas_sp.AAC.1